MKKSILIVEDEIAIVELIKNRLDGNIYDVDIATDGKIASSKIALNTYDLITLDIMLPYIDGFEICKAVRKKSKKTLILMISALETEEFKTKGYVSGCDDYISKPFSAKELAVKIKALLKRREEIISTDLQHIGDVIVNEDLKEIIVNGFVMDFTPSEYFILLTLINNKNKVFSRQDLAQLIYNNNFGDIDEKGINSHIYHIREKVKHVYEKDIIKTVRGMGYKINEN